MTARRSSPSTNSILTPMRRRLRLIISVNIEATDSIDQAKPRPDRPLPQGPRSDCLLLGREAHAARTDQAGVRRLEFPERAADRPLEVNVLVVGPAKGEVGRCQVAVWDWHKAENDAARVDLQHPAEPSRCGPQS